MKAFKKDEIATPGGGSMSHTEGQPEVRMSEQAAKAEQLEARTATSQRSPVRRKWQKQASPPSEQPPKAEGEEALKAPWYRRPWMVTIPAAIFVAAVTVGTVYLLNVISTESTDNAFLDTHVVQVAPRVGGRVAAVHANDNQAVEAGTILVELDPRDFEAVLQQRRAVVQSAVAKRNVAQTICEEAEAHVTTLEANVDVARAEAESAQANLKRAEDDLRRTRQLTTSGALSQQDLQHAISASAAAKANLEAVQKKAAAAVSQRTENQAAVASAKAQIEAANAEIEQAKAAEAAAQLNLSYTKLTAPEAGRITNRTVAPGNYVQLGQTLLAIVPTHLWVTAHFRETQITRMRPGQLAIIGIDAYPGHKFKGHVDSIQRGSGAQFSLLPPENATGNYGKVVQRVPVKIMFDEPLPAAAALGPGMSIVPTVVVRRIVYRMEIIAGVCILSAMVAAVAGWYLLRWNSGAERGGGFGEIKNDEIRMPNGERNSNNRRRKTATSPRNSDSLRHPLFELRHYPASRKRTGTSTAAATARSPRRAGWKSHFRTARIAAASSRLLPELRLRLTLTGRPSSPTCTQRRTIPWMRSRFASRGYSGAGL